MASKSKNSTNKSKSAASATPKSKSGSSGTPNGGQSNTPTTASPDVTTTLRILSTSHRDAFDGSVKTDKDVTFKLTFKEFETVIEEQITDNVIFCIRFRLLSNPQPTLPMHLYTHVSRLHVSCIFPIRWLFSYFSSMPVLRFISFGSGCFADDQYKCTYQATLKLEPSPSVKELFIRVDLQRYNVCLDYIVNHRINTILESASSCFKNLEIVDFNLPLQADKVLTKFREKLTQFLNVGNEHKNYENHQLTFSANTSAAASRPRHGSGGSVNKRGSTSNPNEVAQKKAKLDGVEVITLESDHENDTDEMDEPPTQPMVMPPTPSPEQPQTDSEPPPYLVIHPPPNRIQCNNATTNDPVVQPNVVHRSPKSSRVTITVPPPVKAAVSDPRLSAETRAQARAAQEQRARRPPSERSSSARVVSDTTKRSPVANGKLRVAKKERESSPSLLKD